jgi:hypothetical protein
MINITVNATARITDGTTHRVAGELFQTNVYGTDFASPAERERAMAWLRTFTSDGFHIEDIALMDTERRHETDFTARLMIELADAFTLPNQAVTTRTQAPNPRRG